jgi:hypothetical protein
MRRTLAMLVSVVVLLVPVLGITAEPGAASTQDAKTDNTQAKRGAPPQTNSTTGAKSDRSDVQSRGLFQKKKKKQVGGSAGHSAAEQTDAPGR